MVTHRSLVAGPCSSHLLTLCQNGKQGSDTKWHQTSSHMACSEPRSGNLAVLFVNCLPWNCGASLRAILILSVFPAYKTIITLVTTIPSTSSSSSLAPFAPQLQQPLCAFVALAGKYFPGDCFRERSPSDDLFNSASLLSDTCSLLQPETFNWWPLSFNIPLLLSQSKV